jgi:hypothetical protein
MPDAATLIEKHRGKGVFVDTNLFVLLMVGQISPNPIREFKRTQCFTEQDFNLLITLIGWFGAPVITTPHVLSQVSDLTDLSGPEAKILCQHFKFTVETIQETYDTAKSLVKRRPFERFGLGDASVAGVCAFTWLESSIRL